MNALKVIAVLLIVGGMLGLGYGGFNYTKQSRHADIGSLHVALDERQRVNVPLWASIAALVGGGLLLIAPLRR